MVKAQRSYNVIVFGDEVYGVLAAISAAREYHRRTSNYPRVLIMSKANLHQAIGGQLVRGGLAYLDKSQVNKKLQQSLGLDPFGDPPAIYKEFLHKAGVIGLALDPRKANTVLMAMVEEAQVDILSNVEIVSVIKQNRKIASLTTSHGDTFSGKEFIDCTINAELAQAAGVKKLKGFETFGLPESELPVSVIFETQGLSVANLKQVELAYMKRFINLEDKEAQKFLKSATGFDDNQAEQLRRDMVDSLGNLKTMWVGSDYIDIRSPALSVAYHSFRGKKLSLYDSGVILDKANIAILPGDRLSWNALMFAVTGTQAENLTISGAKPTAKMLEEMSFIQTWFKSIGATTVTSASELYIRHAGNVTGVVEPFTGAEMLMGGVPVSQALGTFAYHFDVRGGIPGIGEKANAGGFKSTVFSLPIFNYGIQHTLIQDIPNLAVVSPASGFKGFACGAGRIIEFNVGVGQGVGIASTIALLNNKNLANILNRDVRRVLVNTDKLPQIFGVAQTEEASRLSDFEAVVI